MTVAPAAGCADCGAAFPLADVLDPAAAGRCPSCGVVFAPDYSAVLASDVREVLAAAAAMDAALRRIDALAPLLRVERWTLVARDDERSPERAGWPESGL